MLAGGVGGMTVGGLQWGGVATISGVALATSTTEVRLGASTVAVLHPANNAMKTTTNSKQCRDCIFNRLVVLFDCVIESTLSPGNNQDQTANCAKHSTHTDTAYSTGK